MARNEPTLYWRICIQIIRFSRLIPIFVILGIVIFCYYIFAFQTIPSLTENWVYRGFLYLVFHIFLFLFLASYFSTIFTQVPQIPDKYYLPDNVLKDLGSAKTDGDRNAVLYRYVNQNGVVIHNVSATDGPRFCSQCQCIKPDRSHHCSMCATCVLRYDHHCPWVNNCIHHANYKFFMLFLFYGLVLCLLVLATSIPGFVELWNGGGIRSSSHIIDKFSVIFLPFITLIFGISLSCLFFYHIYLICRNKTTIEQWYPPLFETGPDPNAYNLGFAQNFKQIFGEKVLHYFLPIYTTSGNGLIYNRRTSLNHRRQMENLRLLDGESSDEGETLLDRHAINV